MVNLMNTFKLGPLSNSGAPKSEINGLLSAVHMAELVVSTWSHIQFSNIHLFSDSQLCLNALKAYSSKLSLYFSERVLEIQNIIENLSIKVHYIESEANAANHGTKLNLKYNAVLPRPQLQWHPRAVMGQRSTLRQSLRSHRR